MQVTPSLSLPVRNGDVPELVRLVGSIMSSEESISLDIDLSELEFASVPVIALIAGVVDWMKANQLLAELRCKRPNKEDPHRYLSRIDFYSHIDVPLGVEMNRHDPTGRFVELRSVTAASGTAITSEIMKMLRAKLWSWPKEVIGCVDLCLGEVIDNACTHSESIYDPIVVAQNYSDRIDIAVVDGGIGLADSLRRNSRYSTLSSKEAFLETLEKGSSCTGDPQRGKGLWFTRELVCSSGGRIEIYSGGLMFSANSYQLRISEVPGYQGTLVYLSFGKQVPDVQEIFKDVGGVPPTILDALDEWF